MREPGICKTWKEFAEYSNFDKKPPETLKRGNELKRFIL